jgi:hypothetical protein
MKEITIISKNDVGALAMVAEALGNFGVNIEAISAYEKDDKAIFRVLTADATTTMKVLGRIPELRLIESDVILVRLNNRPGELGKITRKLANKEINLESLYIVSKKDNETEVAVRPSKADFEKARLILNIK